MIHSHIWVIKTFFTYQQVLERITTNPISILIFPRVPSPPRQILSRGQVDSLYRVTETLKDKALLSLFYGCGLRKSEAEKLNIADIHFPAQLLYVRSGKGRKRRVVPMTKQVTSDLKNYYKFERKLCEGQGIEDRQAFMLNTKGRRMSGEVYWERFKQLLKKANLSSQYSLHHLRHSIATHLLENGLTLEQVRDFLGHRHLETTQIYTRISKKYLISQIK